MWCDQHGLKPEAAAHLMMVTQLDPSREAAWKRLGYRKQGGRWATAEQLAAEKAESEAQKKADKRWTTLLLKLRNAAGRQVEAGRRDQGPGGYLRSSRRPVGLGDASPPATRPIKELAVQVLGQIDSPGSTRALALLALAGKSAEVRSKATQTLRRRSLREIASLLGRPPARP